jgi:Putative prokaryotic signal transducing protein
MIMRELLRSNDLVHLSWAQAALSAAGIESVLLDAHISSIEGNIGAFPRRLMVRDDLLERARKVLAQAEQARARG